MYLLAFLLQNVKTVFRIGKLFLPLFLLSLQLQAGLMKSFPGLPRLFVDLFGLGPDSLKLLLLS